MSIDCIKRLSVKQIDIYFLPHLSFNWRTFSRRVASSYWRKQKKKCELIRISETTDIKLLDEPYINIKKKIINRKPWN